VNKNSNKCTQFAKCILLHAYSRTTAALSQFRKLVPCAGDLSGAQYFVGAANIGAESVKKWLAWRKKQNFVASMATSSSPMSSSSDTGTSLSPSGLPCHRPLLTNDPIASPNSSAYHIIAMTMKLHDWKLVRLPASLVCLVTLGFIEKVTVSTALNIDPSYVGSML